MVSEPHFRKSRLSIFGMKSNFTEVSEEHANPTRVTAKRELLSQPISTDSNTLRSVIKHRVEVDSYTSKTCSISGERRSDKEAFT